MYCCIKHEKICKEQSCFTVLEILTITYSFLIFRSMWSTNMLSQKIQLTKANLSSQLNIKT